MVIKNEERRVTVIALITAACILGDAMLFIVLPIYWESFGLTSLWQVGVLLSANRLIRLPINPLVGWFYRHLDKRTGVTIAIILASISTLSYGLFTGFAILLVMRCLWGVAWSLLRLGGFLTVIEVAQTHNRGQLIGRYNGLWGLGGLVGVLAGGFLADLVSISFVTTIFAIISLASLPIALKYVPKTKGKDEETDENTDEKQSYWKNRQVWAVLLTGVIMAMVVMGIFYSTLSHLVEIHLTTDIVIFSLVIGAASISGLLQAVKWGWDPFLAPLIGKFSDGKIGRIPMLVFVFFATGILFYLFTLNISMLTLLGLLLVFQFMSTIFMTVTDSLATDVASATSKVGVMTSYTIAVDVGSALGPLLGYVIVDFLSLEVLYLLTALLLIVGGALWLLRLRRGSKLV
mgnify:FL=1